MKLIPAVFLAGLCCAAAWAQPTATIRPSVSTYSSSGGSVVFDVVITYPGAVTSLGVTIGRVPPGWSFGGVSGPNTPQIASDPGNLDTFDFAYTNVPPSPVRFSFTANYPAGLTGNQVFSGCLAYVRPADNPTIVVADMVLVAAAAPATAPAISAQPLPVTAAAGQTVSFSVTASGTAPLLYQWRKDGANLSGATSSTLTLTNITAASAGGYSVVVSNAAGSVTSSVAPLTISAPSAVAPQIIGQPISVTAASGATASFSVTASGTTPFSYQWRRNGVALANATSAVLTLPNVTSELAGSYTVVVSNVAGAATSGAAVLTVTTSTPPLAPQISSQPVAQSVAAGDNVVFSVAATGAAALSYQWHKDNMPIPGATGVTLTLSAVTASAAGEYSVVVSNSVGSVTSAAAKLIVTVPPPKTIHGGYFGTFAGGGNFALYVRPNARTADFLAAAGDVFLVAREIAISENGQFRFGATPLATSPRSTGAPATAAAESEYAVEGTLSADAGLVASIAKLNSTLSAGAAASSGLAARFAGFYQAGAAGSSANSYAIVGATGDALVLTLADGNADAGRGRTDAAGGLEFTTAKNARIVGVISPEFATISLTITNAGGAQTLVGASTSGRMTIERLVNISTRSQTSPTAALITGFVVRGEDPKPVLVRAIGPTLAGFGVTGALPAAHLEIFRGSTSVASGDDWGRGPEPAKVAAAAARLGAFPLTTNSRDAALLLTLSPGAYTAVVTGQGGVSGVSLIEAYDAAEGSVPPDERIINVSTRATVGTGDSTLIAGFVITGVVPKRVLVRGIGPGLVPFGVSNALLRPKVAVWSGDNVLAQNSSWGSSADAAVIAQASAQVGAFGLASDSADAALVINLAPGTYTAQVTGVGQTSGIALVELYELP